MPIIPKLECRVETFREDDAVFMRIGIHQEEMLLAYYALNRGYSGKGKTNKQKSSIHAGLRRDGSPKAEHK